MNRLSFRILGLIVATTLAPKLAYSQQSEPTPKQPGPAQPAATSSQQGSVPPSPDSASLPRYGDEQESRDIRIDLDDLGSLLSAEIDKLATYGLINQSFVTALVALFGVFVVFLQFRVDRRVREEQERVRADIKDWKTSYEKGQETFRKDFEDRQHAWAGGKELELRAAISEVVEDKIETFLQDLYPKKITRHVNAVVSALTREALLQTPEIRDLLLSRFQRFAGAFGDCFEGKADNLGKAITEQLGQVFEDWHTLGQLFSSDREQLKMGLLAVRAQPFVEAISWLQRIKERHVDDPDLLPMIMNALRSAETIDA